MSHTNYYIAWDSTALTAATAKTILELPTPANQEVVIKELIIGFDAVVAGSCNIQFGTFVTTGTGTAATPQKWQGNPNVDSAVTAAKIKDTVEPTTFTQGTAGAALYPGIIVPLPSFFIYQWPLGSELVIPESINFGIRLTSTITCNTNGWIVWEE